jgi:transketolase
VRDTFINTLLGEAKRNPEIVLITGDLGFGVVDKFSNELPNQFINTGVNEQAMMSIAAGIASTRKRVFVYSIGNFPTLRCLEQIRNDICLMKNSVVIVSVGAGYAYGPQGYTHHALEDVAVMRALPNMQVFSPCDDIEAQALTLMLCKSNMPAYLRLGKSGEENIHNENTRIEPGKFIETDSGTDGTILFSGSVGQEARLAREILRKRGLEVAVASIPFISDLDKGYLESAAKKGPLVVVEEHSYRGGLGSSILEAFAEIGIQAKVGLVASSQINLSQIGSQDYLRRINGISAEAISSKFTSLLES